MTRKSLALAALLAAVPPEIIPHPHLAPVYIPPTVPILRAMQDMTLEEVVDCWRTNRANCAVMQWKFKTGG